MRYSQEYLDYLQSDTWKRIRRKAIKRAGYTCQRCGIKRVVFDVHHLNYDRLFGRERQSDLEVLCRPCHDTKHGKVSCYFAPCRTCGQVLLVVREWLADGWTRWTCSDGHMREKRGRYE